MRTLHTTTHQPFPYSSPVCAPFNRDHLTFPSLAGKHDAIYTEQRPNKIRNSVMSHIALQHQNAAFHSTSIVHLSVSISITFEYISMLTTPLLPLAFDFDFVGPCALAASSSMHMGRLGGLVVGEGANCSVGLQPRALGHLREYDMHSFYLCVQSRAGLRFGYSEGRRGSIRTKSEGRAVT